MTSLSVYDLWADVQAVRTHAPLVHSITNLVVTHFNANVLLAAGASPIMAHAHEEVADLASVAQALVLNIGTLDPYWVQSMQLAMEPASKRGICVVLDPVGAGATPYRDRTIAALLAQPGVTILRGNASEILSVAGQAGNTRGVDSSAHTDDALVAAKDLAQRLGCVVCISGVTDHIVDPLGRHALLANGHPWMTRITGVGCSATALIGAFGAVQQDAWRATISAMACWGIVGELAAEAVQRRQQGVGSMQAVMLDTLQLLGAEEFAQRLKLSVLSV
ncbi:hydroxyethylthiazole kinase [Candidatus Symbiobacter mobilis]|uniref:Hydroxyethylthiazole kinase n=1 Tax=Candidatus Symbiobacter mobilis CR TaxID=946483 RepID=U5N9N5_9BURK|nr:hydroxyethylthiazole kinase [Candidatus Symbiobacter mobilis]AGX86879.1 hydroxyethylthiazole kinase [Candidatus Symbiobacter mobilis CR]